MRLIYGSVASDSLWLAVGDKGNANQKLFQFGDTLSIPVKIRGKHVQARNKVQQGKLTIDTNAGKVEVQVKMDVPVKAYPDGIFAGAKSPRQIAEKAKEKAKEAAAAVRVGRGGEVVQAKTTGPTPSRARPPRASAPCSSTSRPSA